jgi:hypothetical protein
MGYKITQDVMEGALGRHVRSYQRTLKCKADRPPWKAIVIEVAGQAKAQISFDGRNYHEPITVTGEGSLHWKVAARAIRLKVPRTTEYTTFTLVGITVD